MAGTASPSQEETFDAVKSEPSTASRTDTGRDRRVTFPTGQQRLFTKAELLVSALLDEIVV